MTSPWSNNEAGNIVRDQRFSDRVTSAYQRLCAMCGLDLDLIQGAHIYPASAPSSPDEPWNGLSLCANHHLAFDRHLAWVEPTSRTIVYHPRVLEQLALNISVRMLVQGTFAKLAEPVAPALRPLTEMFLKRYAYFGESYDWVP